MGIKEKQNSHSESPTKLIKVLKAHLSKGLGKVFYEILLKTEINNKPNKNTNTPSITNTNINPNDTLNSKNATYQLASLKPLKKLYTSSLNLNKITKSFKFSKNQILAINISGSRFNNEPSDWDIFITLDFFACGGKITIPNSNLNGALSVCGDIEAALYDRENFVNHININSIWLAECLWAPPEFFVFEKIQFRNSFKVEKLLLRKAVDFDVYLCLRKSPKAREAGDFY